MKKLITVALFMVLFSGFLSSKSAFAAKVNGFNFKPGDILITKSTSPASSGKGFAGHAGIVLPDGKSFVSIAGYGYFPKKGSIDWWLNTKDYKTKVVRDNNSKEAQKAASWALVNFVNVNGKYNHLPYGIVKTSVTSFNKEYCSKMVWQSYYFGAHKNYQVYTNLGGSLVILYDWATPNIIKPYDYLASNYQNHNGFKTVRSFNW